MSDDHEYGLSMTFFDQSESFGLGFEAGCLWREWENCTHAVTQAHSKNLRQLRRMANHYGLAMTVISDDGEWAEIEVTKGKTLSLVKE